jgi:hypothetical protein
MAKEDTQFKKGHIPANKKEGVVLSCLKCAKAFTVQPHRAKTALFCSLSCKARLNMAKEKHHRWKGGKPKCEDCGVVLSNYNNKKCAEHKGMSRESNPKWISDRTKLAILSNGEEYRNSPMSREWTSNVRKRDGWKCRIADNKCSGKVVAHHILPWRDYQELRYEVNNGITLCHFHHPRKRNDEMRLSPYFQELVKVQ